MIKLLLEYGADLDAATPKNWTPLSYCKAKGKYGATEEKGIYPEVGASWAGRVGLGDRVRCCELQGGVQWRERRATFLQACGSGRLMDA